MLKTVNGVIFQGLWRHSCQFKQQKFSLVGLTCTCATPHFEKASATYEREGYHVGLFIYDLYALIIW